jgi:hypothetical protein
MRGRGPATSGARAFRVKRDSNRVGLRGRISQESVPERDQRGRSVRASLRGVVAAAECVGCAKRPGSQCDQHFNRGERFRSALLCGFRGFRGPCAVPNQGSSRRSAPASARAPRLGTADDRRRRPCEPCSPNGGRSMSHGPSSLRVIIPLQPTKAVWGAVAVRAGAVPGHPRVPRHGKSRSGWAIYVRDGPGSRGWRRGAASSFRVGRPMGRKGNGALVGLRRPM